ncbi:DUF4748 domain-containing protein [Electrophorus electricus]|uniref:DUF4748 domain-containing protein n=1 Tax=Electrophorus electricus TaxID=8005 RepID=UPI0015D00417|nr:DUF4748 domain-containing protein [Electrophorus electricus]
MAAPCRTLARTAMDGMYRLSASQLRLRAPLVPNVRCLGSQQCALRCRALHSTRYPLHSCTEAEPQKTAKEEEAYRPEYIPKRKAKNPMMIIGYSWMVGLPAGIIMFILAKRQVDKNRLKQLKIRRKMKRANESQYESQRYNITPGTD